MFTRCKYKRFDSIRCDAMRCDFLYFFNIQRHTAPYPCRECRRVWADSGLGGGYEHAAAGGTAAGTAGMAATRTAAGKWRHFEGGATGRRQWRVTRAAAILRGRTRHCGRPVDPPMPPFPSCEHAPTAPTGTTTGHQTTTRTVAARSGNPHTPHRARADSTDGNDDGTPDDDAHSSRAQRNHRRRRQPARPPKRLPAAIASRARHSPPSLPNSPCPNQPCCRW